MSSTYNINLTNGTSLTTLMSLESNGQYNQSTPRRIVDIDFSTSPPQFMVGDNVTARFVPGFSFQVFDSAYAGTYTVDVAGSTYANDVTSIPVVEPIAVNNYVVIGVSTADSYWKVVSNGNDTDILYPGSTFTVTGNTIPAANIVYTVVNAVTAIQHTIVGVTPGVGGSWTISGVHNEIYDIGDDFVVSRTGGNAVTGDGTYTIASKVVGVSTTTLVVTGTVPAGAVAQGAIITDPPYAKVFVTPGSIPIGTTATGSGTSSSPTQFALSAPPAIVLASPNTFDITWRISGDHTTRFVVGCGFNIKGNSAFAYHTFIMTVPSTFSSGMTHITGRINSATTPTPDSTGYLIHPIASTQTGFIQYQVPESASSLQLIGKGAPYYNNTVSWGHALMNNAVHQLEHHANTIPPIAPLIGQIWYDETSEQHRTLNYSTIQHDIIGVDVVLGVFTITDDHTGDRELQVGELIAVYNNTGMGIPTHIFEISAINLVTGNTEITVVEPIPAGTNISGKLYGVYLWNGMVTATVPVTNFVHMNDFPIVHVEDIPAAHEYTIIPGDTPFDNDFQGNALNLRSANTIFVNVSGDSMTGDLTMNTGVDINMTDGNINMNATSAINFPVDSTGDIDMNGANSINFPVGSTGGIYLDGNNDLIVTGTGRVDLASNEQRLNGDSFILFTDTSTGDITLAGDNDIIFPATATGDIVINGANNLLFAGTGRVDFANNEQRMNGTSFINFPVGSTGDVTLQGANDIIFSGTGTINMGGNKITNLANATVATDALNMQTGDTRYVNVTGDTMTGGLSMTSANITMAGTSTMQFTGTGQVDMGTNKVVNLATPTSGTDATNKAYVDAYVSGIVFLTPVKDPNVYNDEISAPPGSPVPYTRTYIVKPTAYTITGRTTGAGGKWIINGNYASLFANGNTFIVNGNSDGPSNGTYTVASAANVTTTTEITITGTVPAGAGANGTVYHSSGAWNGKDGHALTWDGASWVDVLGRAIIAGDRFGIYLEPDNDEVPIVTAGMGATLIPVAGKIGTIQAAVTAPGYTALGSGSAWVFYTPIEPDAVSVTGPSSQHFGHSYTFRGTYGSGTYNSAHKWIEFSGPTAVIDGAGLKFTGNVLNIGAGSGITVAADTVALDTAYIASNVTNIEVRASTTSITTTPAGWAGVTANYGIPVAASGADNVSIGRAALHALTNGASNTAIGPQAGALITTGSNNVILGGYQGSTGLADNIVLSTGAGTVRLQHDGTKWTSATPIEAAGITLTSTTSPLTLNASVGTSGQVLVSAGAGATPTWANAREQLTANRTYYVRTDGNNSNTGLTNTSGGAFLTIQKAVDVVSTTLDLNVYNVTIQVEDGTYTTPVVLKACVGQGTVTIQGNTGAISNVIISTTSNNCISNSSQSACWLVDSIKLTTTTSGTALYVSDMTSMKYSNVDFGAASNHISMERCGRVICTGNYTISGNATTHVSITGTGSEWQHTGSFTVTLTGTPAFTTFVVADNLSLVRNQGVTYSGSATGVRYSGANNSVISTNGGGATYFPGNSAGSTSTGSIYN